ncbi:tetratricopeptide repeat protein [Aquincola sp. S2]|uniref:Tetratricopeptide repeat protein n=1 Tax=Pseudaquabacterium terrae TaxID=2732868 RepID=A0ABX2EDC3_9BURK|nr:tetratricopeptide repeat protein [Aquabacterium terrae]NRF66674.1 tetratricopeptide repeat protein [Aquabacterium terrae]
MGSILLAELDKRIRTSTDSVSWARDVCRAASHFARQGQVDAAMKWMDSVKAHFGNRIDPEVACWLMLAEGMLHYFQMRSTAACDRFRGAYGLAATFKVTRAWPCSAAWMALIDFNDSRYDSMVRFIEEALTQAPEDDHQARARASLVLADAFHFTGSFKKARPWYERARRHATAEGDGATMSALMHNMAAYRTANVRLADALGNPMSAEVKQASMEAASAFNYDAAIGTESLRLMVPMLQGELLAVEGKFHEALMMLASIDKKELAPRFRPLVAVDQAWCLVHLELFDHVSEFALQAAAASHAELEADDLAYLLARLAQVQERMGERYLKDCSMLASHALARHREIQRMLELNLDQLEDRVKSA